MSSMIITIDKGIELPASDKPSLNARYGAQLRSMDIGDSFFIQGRSASDTELVTIIKMAFKLGVYLEAVSTDEDEVYLEPGVRVWRVADQPASGNTEPKPDRSADAPVLAKKTTAGHQPLRFWMLESDDYTKYSVWSSSKPVAEQGIAVEAQSRVVEITEEQFDTMSNGTFETAYWIDRSTGSWAMDVVGITPPKERSGGWEQVDFDTYKAFLGNKQPPASPAGGDGFIYARRRSNGSCRKIKLDSLTAKQIKQLDTDYERIDQATFDAWEADNEL